MRGKPAKVFTYGIPQDEAARTGTGSADIAESTTTLAGKTFTWSPEPYSVTVIQISKPKGDDDGDWCDDNDHHDRD